jgi:transcriptional regulator with XRE-family HTH domain
VSTNKRVGQILREVREEKNLSVKDVSRDTNIAIKFVIALENEDYAQFPAETFTIGFLKNYSDYLKLDTAGMMNLYRGEQLVESQQPLEELTKPTVKMIALELKSNKLLPLGIILGVCLAVSLVYYFSENSDSSATVESNTPVETTENPNPVNPSLIPDISYIQQSVPENSSVPFTLTPEQGFKFSVNNQQCKIFIKGVKKVDGENFATIGFNIFPEKKVYTFESKVGSESVLSYNNPELTSLRREIKIVTQAVTDSSAKILVRLSGEAKPDSNNKPIGDVPIQVTLYFIRSSYVEFIIDGQTGERGLVSSGETKQLEARDRLEIKVGDGGAVEMIQNGKEKVKLGRPGRLAKKIFLKAPSPYDNTQFIIKELGE